MKRSHVHLAAALLAALLASSWGAADERDPSPPAEERAPSDERGEDPEASGGEDRLTIYVPPSRGTTRTRTGGGTRAPGGLPALSVLAPDHVGLTARAAPTLAWFVDAPADLPLELSVLRDGAIEPVLEVVVTEQVAPGIGEASLERWGVALEQGATYQWSVALVADPERRDRDVVASGAIRRVAAGPELRAVLEEVGPDPDYRVLARRGLWYDALAELSRRIAAGEGALRAERAALLEQVGLAAAAAHERAEAP